MTQTIKDLRQAAEAAKEQAQKMKWQAESAKTAIEKIDACLLEEFGCASHADAQQMLASLTAEAEAATEAARAVLMQEGVIE